MQLASHDVGMSVMSVMSEICISSGAQHENEFVVYENTGISSSSLRFVSHEK